MWNCINLSSVLAIVNAILCLLISSIVSYLFHLIWIYVVNSIFAFCIQIKHNIDRSLLTWKNFQHNECFFFVEVKKELRPRKKFDYLYSLLLASCVFFFLTNHPILIWISVSTESFEIRQVLFNSLSDAIISCELLIIRFGWWWTISYW